MNNEPIAWMYQIHDITGWTWVFSQSLPDYEYRNEKPLYTQPAELTDEEILKLEEIEFDNYCVDKESKGRKTATITDPEWAIWFARAILRKAQEK